jgi:hypothetical protein
MNRSEITKDLRICDDYLQFQNHLKDLRKLDDLIIQTLNTTVLTKTFLAQGSDATKQCQQLGDEVFLLNFYYFLNSKLVFRLLHVRHIVMN